MWLLRNAISDAKCKIDYTVDNIHIDHDHIAETNDPDAEANIVNAFNVYHSKLKEFNALDFDDLLIKTVSLFEQVGEVQQEYHDNFSHILVDEYHDVNEIQYQLLRFLTVPPENNLMVVADADQSIYSWRGSNPLFIDHFKTNYSPHIVELDDHYRCSETILRAAEEVIANNPLRQTQYSLKTHKDKGRDIFHYTFMSPVEEARNIIRIIKKLIQ